MNEVWRSESQRAFVSPTLLALLVQMATVKELAQQFEAELKQFKKTQKGTHNT
jgi:hypothetical protein